MVAQMGIGSGQQVNFSVQLRVEDEAEQPLRSKLISQSFRRFRTNSGIGRLLDQLQQGSTSVPRKQRQSAAESGVPLGVGLPG